MTTVEERQGDDVVASAAAPRFVRFGGLRALGTAARTSRGRIGLLLAGIVVAIAVLGPFVSPHGPTALSGIPFAHPGGGHWFGGDVLGRDVLSRVLNGGWVLLIMAAASTVIGVVAGATAGIAAGYLQGRSDGVIMRTVDVILAFPQLIFALLLVSILGAKLWLIVLAVGIGHAPQVARVLRAATLDVSERDFVKAIQLQGVKPLRIMRQEVLPNLVTPLMVEAGLRLTFSIVTMSGLAFLGFGQAPPAANWGLMINENRVGLVGNPWAVAVPAALIALLTIGVNTYADAVARVSIGADGRSEETLLAEAAVAGVTV